MNDRSYSTSGGQLVAATGAHDTRRLEAAAAKILDHM